MKPLTIITSLLILLSSGAFAKGPCTDCGSFLNEKSEATATTLDHLQQESQLSSFAPSTGLTQLVMHKMNTLKTEYSSTSDTFDRLQKETEEISIAQPILMIASMIEKSLNNHHVKNQNTSAGSASK